MKRPLRRTALLAATAAALLAGCTGDFAGTFEAGAPPPDEVYGMDGELQPTPPPGKFDSPSRSTIPVNTDTRATQVWTVENAWEDTDTPAAREAGIAWEEDSGLTWDQKYARWIQSLERTEGVAGWYDTFTLTTPWGVELPSPSLECAEMSLFLRITFAAWYNLPLAFEAVDRHGDRVFFGHFGARTANGRYNNTPKYGYRYEDYSDMSRAEYEANWPSDSSLRSRRLWGGEDEQPMLGEGEVFGAYLDEIHLNKRAGYFTALAINYLGSVNLADSANTYNIVPEAVAAGDTLIHRWQRTGIGHTLVVKDVVPIGEGNLDSTVLSGSMPRRQGKWESGAASKRYFTASKAGGEGENSDGREYARLGGGLKRYRVAKNVGGMWTNTFMQADEAHWINSTDYDRLAERPGTFENLLGEVSPEAHRESLLTQIEDARRHLRDYPASCAARERREEAFEELYDLEEREFDNSRASVDARVRTLEDYVFSELEYTESKTCCWLSSTNNMHEIIMEYARREMEAAEERGQCVKPTVFMSYEDGYDRFRELAQELGRGDQWVEWSAGETCPWQDVAVDTEREHDYTEFCELDDVGGGGGDDDGGGSACDDASEPNDREADAAAIAAGDELDLSICDADDDWFTASESARVSISFSHDEGDLDLESFTADGSPHDSSYSTSDAEAVDVPAGGTIRVYGYRAATAAYTLTVD